MTIHPRNNNTNRFSLFEEIFGNVSNNTVLDFGGSSGNLLYFSNKKIKETNYTCLDISKEAIEHGAFEFPKANWVHYDRFNLMYNPHGNKKIVFPKINLNQDVIWAYSVFSHVDADELIKTVEWLCTFNFKKIAISFLDINIFEMKEYFYNKRMLEYGCCDNILKNISSKDADFFYFLDNSEYEINKRKCECVSKKYFLSFFNVEWILESLKNLGISAKVIRPGEGYIPFLIIERL
jgi:hypothetical protein